MVKPSKKPSSAKQVQAGSKRSLPLPEKKRRVPKPVDRKGDAIRRLDLTAIEIERVPKITEILKSSFKSVAKAIEAIRFSNETAAIEFLAVYDAVPVGDMKYLSIEAVCAKAKINPLTLLGAATYSARAIRGHESALIAVNAFPDVVRNMVKYAELPGGDRDRKMLAESQVIGFLPTPKGGTFNVNLGSAANGPSGSVGYINPEKPSHPVEPEDENFNELFPNVMQNQEKWAENRRALLADRN